MSREKKEESKLIAFRCPSRLIPVLNEYKKEQGLSSTTEAMISLIERAINDWYSGLIE